MFESVFKTTIASLISDPQTINDLYTEIKQHYSKPSRHYHSLAHLEQLVYELLSIKENISDWQTLVFSIAYHDIIYHTLKSNNEERSAQFANKKLTQLSVPINQREKCVHQILATKAHTISADEDTNFFTDADLAILGTNPSVYQQYTQMIRKEYKIYPAFIYKPGRKKVVQHFLQMPHIYKTDYFRSQYEQQARENLIHELHMLSS